MQEIKIEDIPNIEEIITKTIEFKEVVDTEPAKTIVKQATIMMAEAIVMGTSGLGLMSAALLGSVSAKVVTNAQCPVIIVK